MTVSLVGMEAGVGGRGFIRDMGVAGGSMFGATFFHASTNVESSAASAGTSAVASARRAVGATVTRETRRRAAWRSIFFLSLSTPPSPLGLASVALEDFDGCGREKWVLGEAGGAGDLERVGRWVGELLLGWAGLLVLHHHHHVDELEFELG